MGLNDKRDRECIRLYLTVLRTCIETFHVATLKTGFAEHYTEEQIRELKQTCGETALEQIEHIKSADKAACLTVMMLYHNDLAQIKHFLDEKEL